jgi:membrane protease YdiL (CAAX protease family)
MQTTSSPTSATPSSDYKAVPFFGWSILAILFIAGSFIGREVSAEDTKDVFYDYGFAVTTIVYYAALVGLTFALAIPYPRTPRALGLNRFRWRWVAIAVGLILGVLIVSVLLEPLLHGGREQGLSPDEWQPEHARAFLLNGIIVSTVVPFTEELFFRGLGVRALQFFGGISAVVITGFVFGFSLGILAALPPLVLFGIALGWVRLRSDSVWPGMFAHGFYNGVGILIVYLQLAY